VKRRTTGLMQPHLAPSIEKATRKAYPDGIPAFGTDALRFSFASLATQSADIRFDLQRVAGYRNFCNKLWNASRFVLMMVEGSEEQPADPLLMTGPVELSVADRWITSRLGQTLTEVDAAFRDYRFDFAATALYEFTWYSFCDWYLELTKPVLQASESSDAARRGARRTLVTSLEALLRALHPIMPFITEEIWQRVAPIAGARSMPTADGRDSIVVAHWPRSTDYPRDALAERDIAWIQQVVLGIRQIRGEMDISPARKLPVLLENAAAADLDCAREHRGFLERLAGLESLRVLGAAEVAPPSATALVGDMKVLVPMAGLIDPRAELDRLAKRSAKTQAEIAKARAKLGNEKFVSNAPPEVVAQEQARVADFERQLQGFEEQSARVRQLLAEG